MNVKQLIAKLNQVEDKELDVRLLHSLDDENHWLALAPCVIRSRFLGKYRGICLVCQRRFSLKRLRFLEWIERDPGKGIAWSASFMVWRK